MNETILGKFAQDEPTGFKGVITARCEHLGGYVCVQLESVVDGPTKPASESFDLNRVTIF